MKASDFYDSAAEHADQGRGQLKVLRQFAFDLETFDLFKDWCRRLQAGSLRQLSNSDVFRALLLSAPRP